MAGAPKHTKYTANADEQAAEEIPWLERTVVAAVVNQNSASNDSKQTQHHFHDVLILMTGTT